MCLADLAATYICEKADMNYEPGDEKSYIKPVAEILKEEDLKTTITVKLNNGLGKMRKIIQPIVLRFKIISKFKSPEEYYLILLQSYMSWRDGNQLKECHQSYEKKKIILMRISEEMK